MARRGSECPRVRVAALIVIDGRIVLVRHRAGDSTYHLLPGGGVDYRETLEKALEREVLEETGLHVAVGRPILLNDTIDPMGPRHVVNITFDTRVTGGNLLEVSADPRVEAIELVTPDVLSGLDFRPPMADEVAGFVTGRITEAMYLGSLFTLA